MTEFRQELCNNYHEAVYNHQMAAWIEALYTEHHRKMADLWEGIFYREPNEDIEWTAWFAFMDASDNLHAMRDVRDMAWGNRKFWWELAYDEDDEVN